MTTSYWRRKSSFKAADMTTDVLIIGGGYVGLSTAFWLTEMRPELKITIIDRSQCGAGASGRNAGFLTLGSASFYKGLTEKWGHEKALQIFQFAEESIDLVYHNILKVSPEVKFDRASSLTLFQNEKQFLDWRSESFSTPSFKFDWRLQDQLPLPLQETFFGAYESAPEFKINPIQLLESLKNLLINRKVQILENVMAAEIGQGEVMTEIMNIKSKQIVLAMNGYSRQFHSGFEKIIKPYRAQMLAVELDEEFDCPSLHYDSPDRVYWRKVGEKNLIIGGKRLLDEQGETGDFEKISPVIQRGLEQYLTDRLKLKYKVLDRWSGTMGFTEHELPLSGKMKSDSETYLLGGFSGHGMGLGFRSAKDLAEVMTGYRKESFFDQFKKVEVSL